MSNKFASELDAITDRVIGCAFKVGTELGAGFAEKIYENALAHELLKAGLKVGQRHGIKVKYDGVLVGEYVADLLVDDCVLAELKAVKLLDPAHVAQCYNYLRAAKLKVCLLLNFGRKKVEVRRLVNNF